MCTIILAVGQVCAQRLVNTYVHTYALMISDACVDWWTLSLFNIPRMHLWVQRCNLRLEIPEELVNTILNLNVVCVPRMQFNVQLFNFFQNKSNIKSVYTF